jgi:Predicted acetyltransferase involved in intracellular survival and related acetyltransferases
MSSDAAAAIRQISTQEFPEFYRTLLDAFGADVRDSDRVTELAVFEPERSLAAFDHDLIVATAGAYTRQLTLPGRTVPIAAVTLVGVAPTHRRRGLLTAMMRRQLTEVFEARRESVAALWASEASIYGRFGYGLAARHAVLTGHTRRMGLRPATDPGSVRIRQVAVAEIPLLADGMRERLRQRTVGWLDRPGRWWENQTADPEHRRGAAGLLRAVVCEQADGEIEGYALYRITADWQPSEPNHTVEVRDLAAATPAAYAAVWSFLLNLDLVRLVRAPYRPLDEPLQHLVTDARSVELALADNLWVRTVDVGGALAARCYAREVDVVLEVADDFCPWNTGRWRLTGGPEGAACSRTVDAADLALTSTELGALLLGGTSLAVLTMAGRVRELSRGAVTAVGGAFATDRAPWCPEVF